MNCVVFMCLIGAAFGQLNIHGHDLKTLIDTGFERIDHSPKDGIVLENEWDVLIERDDANNDSCVTQQEYTTAHARMPPEVSTTMYQHFDADANGCLTVTDMQNEYHLIDHNADNQVTMHEFEQYMSHLMNKLFGSGAGHGNH